MWEKLFFHFGKTRNLLSISSWLTTNVWVYQILGIPNSRLPNLDYCICIRMYITIYIYVYIRVLGEKPPADRPPLKILSNPFLCFFHGRSLILLLETSEKLLWRIFFILQSYLLYILPPAPTLLILSCLFKTVPVRSSISTMPHKN